MRGNFVEMELGARLRLRVHYKAKGCGEPIILIHGLGGSTLDWRENIDFLAQYFRVYAIDLPGHGYSDKPRIDYTLPFAIDFLQKFLDLMRLERVSLVGCSTGGLVTLGFSLKYPQRVKKLVLVDSSGLGREVSWILRLATFNFLEKFLFQPTRSRVKLVLERRVFYDKKFVTPELVEEIYRIKQLPGVQRVTINVLKYGVSLFGQRNKVRFDQGRRLKKLDIPTLIIWGKEDKVIPLSHGYRAFRKIPKATLHVLSQCGHWPQMEKAREFNELVSDFLKD